MKYCLSFILFLLATLCVDAAKMSSNIVVLSDLHVVEPSQAQSLTLGKGERKLLTHSAELLELAIKNIEEEPPRVLLITGDLTDRGDLASHKWVAAQLQRIKALGTTVLVIPGNHDIGKEVSKEQFAQIYADYGYYSSTRDNNSLSYVCEPVNGLVVLGIDSNGDSGAAIKWAANQASNCKGKNVIAMMHHHLVPHFYMEEKVLATSVVDGSQVSRDALMKAGVHMVFTGHTHIHDAAGAYNSERTDSILDVCTGALAGYPHPYRVLSLSGNKIKSDASLKLLHPRLDQAKGLLEDAVPAMVQSFGRKYWDKAIRAVVNNPLAQRMLVDGLDWEMVSGLIGTHLTPTLSKMYVITSCGNEPEEKDVAQLKADLQKGIIAVIQGVVRPQFRETAAELLAPAVESLLMPVVDSILDDTNPPLTTTVNDNSFLWKGK